MQFNAQQSMFALVQLAFSPYCDAMTLSNYQGYFFRLINKITKQTPIDPQVIEKEINSIPDKNQAKRLADCIVKIEKSKIQKSAEIVHFLFRTAQKNKLYTSAAISTIFSDCSLIKPGHSIEIENAPMTTRSPEYSDTLIKSILTEKQNFLDIRASELMRDLLFCLQGIEGQNINYDASLDSFCLNKEVVVTNSTRQLVNIICECGWLFKNIQTFCKQQQSSLIVQALQNAIKQEIIEYFKLIANFEGLLQSEQLITLKLMYMKLRSAQDILMYINQVLSIIETNMNLGSTSALILNTLNHFCKHGCPVTSALFFRLQQASCQPFIKYINTWVFDGKQNDISKEFFIERDESQVPIKDQGELWVKQYKLNYDKVPSILSFEDAYKIFDTGRAINWLRNQCELRNWHLELQPLTINMLQTNKVTEFVNLANTKTNNQLVSLLFNKFHLKNHFSSIKQYLLLGNGNFGQALIEILYQELSKHAHLVYKHTLLGLVETALRASNAPTLIQQKLSIKLLEPSKHDLGWDIFCLDYEFNEPLNTVFNNRARLNYQRIFNNLWRIKRVEYTLIQCWSVQINFKAHSQRNSIVNKTLNLSLQLMNEMIHFIKNFFSYILLEAIEAPFKKMIDQVEKITDLDSLISVHEKFQQEIIEKTFLNDKLSAIQENLQKIFEVCLRYSQNVEDLLLYARDVISSDRNDQYQQSLSSILSKSKTTKIQSINKQGQEQIKLLLQLRDYFREQMGELIVLIQKEDRLKFLQFKLDFNEYYLGLQSQRMFSQGFDVYQLMLISRFLKQCLPSSIKESLNNTKASQEKPSTLVFPAPQTQRPIAAIQQDFIQINEGIKLLQDSKKKQESQQKDFYRLPPKPPIPNQQQQSPGFQFNQPTPTAPSPLITQSPIEYKGQQSLNQMMQQFQQQQQQQQQQHSQLQLKLSNNKILQQSPSQLNASYQRQNYDYSPQSQQFLQTQQSYLQQLSNIGPSVPFSHQSQSQISIQQDNLLMSQDENILQMIGGQKYDDDSSDEDLI